MHPSFIRIGLVVSVAFALTGCASPGGGNVAEKRQSVLDMRAEAMPAFEKAYPGVTKRANQAPGYAVFSNFGLKIFLIGGGNGYGVVHDNALNTDRFMRMGELNVGLGLGGKDFRALFIFNNPRVMRKFIHEGWEFGGDAEVGVKAKGEGGELGKSVSVNDIDVYQITRNGAMIDATVGGTKYWIDDDLNEMP